MVLSYIDNAVLREKCRSRIEGLEIWLRRIIAEELALDYGSDFIIAKVSEDNFLFKKALRDSINKRYSSEPSLFPRPIDAAFFENLIDIFCKPELYEGTFKKYLIEVYPESMQNGYLHLRFCLERLKNIRNNLSHANTISERDAEYSLSLTTEFIESFKSYYNMQGKHQEYNVPQIIRIVDSFGNTILRRNFDIYEQHDFSRNPRFYLRPGDEISIEVEVDPSYTDAKYQFRFGGTDQDYSYSNKLIYIIKKSDVDPRKPIYCQVRSDKDWHKQFNMDDQITLFYKVLPPIE